MLFRVFSSLLAENTKWYALNDRLCGKEPRKFRENSVFSLFTDEIRRLKFEDLRDENGGHVLPGSAEEAGEVRSMFMWELLSQC